MKIEGDRKKQCKHLQAKSTSASSAQGSAPKELDFSATRKHAPVPEDNLSNDLQILKNSHRVFLVLS